VLGFYQKCGNSDGPFDPVNADDFYGDVEKCTLERMKHANFTLG
jgi:hypothetical protein